MKKDIQNELSKANLSERSLSERSLSETILSETSLSETNLSETSLSETSLSETNQSETSLSETSLSETSLSENELNSYHENKVHSTRLFPYNTYICTIPLDFSSVPVHWHDDFELIVIKKGSGICTINFKRYEVSAGDVLIVLPGILHSIDESVGGPMEYENILLKKELLQFSANDITEIKYLEPFFNGSLNTRIKISPKHSFYNTFIDTIDYLDTLCAEASYGYQLAVKGAIIHLIYLLITHPGQTEADLPDGKNIDKLKSILAYTATHYYEVITIDEIAAYCHYSPSHFMKFFKKHTGISYISYLNDYRVTEARNLIATTSLSILEISERCGFTNLSNFNRTFKHKYGVSPSKLR